MSSFLSRCSRYCSSRSHRQAWNRMPGARARLFSSTTVVQEAAEEERESMPVDVLIVGGGPAGLAASIRLKQLCAEHDKDLSVCVIDKGSEIGAHILSGNVFDPRALNELFPEWSSSDKSNDETWVTKFQDEQGSHATPVKEDQFYWLGSNLSNAYGIPNFLLPSELHNDGNYIISLSQLCRWLSTQAENLGVEIYPGFAADQIRYSDTGAVQGIITKDVGIDKNGEHKSTFELGMELHARQTIFAEGARGSCTEELIKNFKLREEKGAFPQTYALGIKEVWQISDPENNPHFNPGYVQHTIGYPLQSSIFDQTFGGSFLYHQEPDLVLLGVVVGLGYENPYINPYQEFQRWKLHNNVKKYLDNGDATCISYGARVLNEGGYHSIPKLTFPGGLLTGCSAGFLNTVKIKGTHTAMKSGILAAENVYNKLTSDESITPVAETGELPANEELHEIKSYESDIENSWITSELYKIRNVHEAFSKGKLAGGMVYTGLSSFITKGKEPWTFKPNKARDTDKTKPKAEFKPIDYPSPDGKITFDLLTNLQRSNTYHDDDQPSHLRIKPELNHIPGDNISLEVYDAPEQRFCPAGVYEYVDSAADENSSEEQKVEACQPGKKLVINAQNCIHCKCCSIKTPEEYIKWTVPEGGGGPQYQVM